MYYTIFKQNNGNQSVLYLAQTKDTSIQSCRFVTCFTVVTIVTFYEHKFNEINLRMSKSYFSLKTIDQHTKIIHLQGKAQISWMLWKTEFQINCYQTISSDKYFAQNISRIVSYEPRETFHGTISETQYASGDVV